MAIRLTERTSVPTWYRKVPSNVSGRMAERVFVKLFGKRNSS